MGTCMGTGEAAGTAAALGIRQKVSPKALDIDLLRKTLAEQGVIL
jgi:hypothetical protein